MAALLCSPWLALQGAEPRADDEDDDEEGGGLPAPVPVPPRRPSGWPPRIRLFLPPALPVPCPVGA